MKETFSTFLPCFPGFYESPLYHSDMESDMLDAICDDSIICFPASLMHYFFEKHHLGSTFDLQMDFPAFMRDTAKAYCAEIAGRLTEILGQGFDEIFIEFEEIKSPREYNFETDSVNCKITFDADRALEYCREHPLAFRKYLIDNYKSRDGFISYFSSNVNDWLDRENWGTHEPGAILQFILRNETPDVEIYASERVQESVNYTNYFWMPEAIETFLESQEAEKISKEFCRLMKQGDDYLEAMGKNYREVVRKAKENIPALLLDDMENAIANAV